MTGPVMREGPAPRRPGAGGADHRTGRGVTAVYTVTETAERLKVSPWTVRRWISEGVLEGFRLGREWRVVAAPVDELVKGA